MSEVVEICIKEGFTEDCQHKEQYLKSWRGLALKT